MGEHRGGERERRLAEALRINLKRRKAQQRERSPASERTAEREAKSTEARSTKESG
jgi:hypothetical protein